MGAIKRFKEINKNNVDIAGGKGASLGEMLNAGIPVPNGFVVLAPTFDKFLEITDINVEIDAVMDTVNHEDINTVEQASEKIEALIMNVEMPKEISEEILSSFDDLGSKFVAVRSSATSEDSASAAWAGQLETYLNTTKETLLKHVQKCWASLFTPRAIFYRFEKGLHQEKVSVAVVVQEMVNSEESGIAFSVHPVTEDPNQLIIEAGFGLGEAIVSGSITPDSYVVDKQGFNIIDVNVSEQAKGLFRLETGGNEWKELSNGSEQVLTKEEIIELSKLIVKIEKHYGFPCDIEWAREGGEFFITQSRPITTLSNLEEPAKGEKKNSETFINKTVLSKTYSREHSLFYFNVWCRGNIEGLKEYITKILFKMVPGEPTTVWHDHKEIALAYKEAGELAHDFSDTKEIVESYARNMNQIIEYIEGKPIDIEKFYNLWVETWPLLAKVFVIPDTTAPKESRELALKERNRTQEYSDSVENVYFRYFKENFPELDKYKFVILPNELFKLKDKDYLAKLLPELEKRLKNPIYFYNNQIYFEEEFKKLDVVLEEQKAEIKDNIIKGNSGFKGKVKGVVRIVKLKSELSKIQENEILVTPMTAPDFVPYLPKVKAIVTDEGGVTCHAAIVSRELGKPCVIGTKISTQVLKDGMEVEVDADEGVVRIVGKTSSKLIDEFLEGIGNDKLKLLESEFIPLFLYEDWISSCDSQLNVKKTFDLLTIKIGKPMRAYINDTNYAKIAEKMLEDYLNNKVTIETLHQNYLKYAKETETLYEDYHNKKFSNEETKIKALKQAADLLSKLVIATLFIERLDRKIVENVAKKRDIDLEKVWELSETMDFMSFENKNNVFILEALKNNLNKEKLRFVYANYTYQPTVEDVEEILSKINIKELEKEVEEQQKIVEENKKRVQELSEDLNEIEKQLLKYLKWAMEIRDIRKEFIHKTQVLMYNLTTELYKEWGLDLSLVRNSSVLDVLKGKEFVKNNLDLIEKRTKGFVSLYKGGDDVQEVYEGMQESIDKLDQIVIEQTGFNKTEMKGEKGSKGFYKGKIRIIIKKSEFDDFKQGEILVTSMTRPEFVPLMKKAGAVITDEGGITCHAAIVSRELGIPCIIGTKVATKLLKDGMEVEVDADTGVVKIIK